MVELGFSNRFVAAMIVWLLSTILLGVLAAGADINYLRETITNHFSINRNHDVNNVNKNKAREFIFEEFRKYGLEAEYNDFGDKIAPTTLFSNVVGVLKGANFGTVNDKIIGLAAHYDTVDITSGVDDNGAGVAAMLEVARQLGDQNAKGVKRNNTMVFLAPDLEEYGYIGSAVFIDNWLYPWLLRNYGQDFQQMQPHGVIVLDTMMEYNTSSFSQEIPDEVRAMFQHLFPQTSQSIASDNFRGDFLAMIFRAVSDNNLAHSFQVSWITEKRDQFELESFPLPFQRIQDLNSTVIDSFGNFLRSDHRNFWASNLNIPAIFLTDSANFRGDMIQCYHHQCDNLATMLTEDNLNFLAKTADTIARTMDDLSEPLNKQTSGTSSSYHSVVCLAITVFVAALPTPLFG